MTEVEKWAEERGGLVLMGLPIAIATAAEEVYEMCVMARENKLLLGEEVRPSPEIWSNLYRNHRIVSEGVIESFGTALFPDIFESDAGEEEPEVLDEEGNFDSETFLEWARTMKVEAEAWIRTDLDDDGEPPENAKEILSKPEVLFFFRVTMPCWLNYAQAPCQLLRRARRGCQESTLKLLNLDPWIQEDRQVRHAIIDMQRCENFASKVSKAMKGEYSRPLKRSQVKILLAGLIDRVHGKLDDGLRTVQSQYPDFQLASIRLGGPDIRALLDAAARDKGQEMDEDIPESPEAFYKAIYRAREFWGDGIPSFF